MGALAFTDIGKTLLTGFFEQPSCWRSGATNMGTPDVLQPSASELEHVKTGADRIRRKPQRRQKRMQTWAAGIDGQYVDGAFRRIEQLPSHVPSAST